MIETVQYDAGVTGDYMRLMEDEEYLRECAMQEGLLQGKQQDIIDQCFYLKSVGDLSLSTKKEERALYASDGLECIFEKIIPEIGKSVINISMGC